MTKFDSHIEKHFSSLVEAIIPLPSAKEVEKDAAVIATDYQGRPLAKKAMDLVIKNPDKEISAKYKELQVAKKRVLVPQLQKEIERLKSLISATSIPPVIR